MYGDDSRMNSEGYSINTSFWDVASPLISVLVFYLVTYLPTILMAAAATEPPSTTTKARNSRVRAVETSNFQPRCYRNALICSSGVILYLELG